MLPGRARSTSERAPPTSPSCRRDPARAKPLVGEREEELVLETLRSRRLALGPRLGEFEAALAGAARRRAHVSAVSSGTAGLHLAIRAAGIEAGDEVVTTPFSFVASANCLLYENAQPGVLRHRPAHAQHRPGGGRGGGHRAHHRACCRCTSSATPPTCPRFERAGGRARPLDRRGRLRGARRHATPTARRSARAATWRCSASTPTSSSPPARAARWSVPTRPSRQRIDSERNQGRAPDMGWLDHDRLGFNYRLDDLSCALGLAQLERLDELLAGARARGGALRARRWRASRASSCPAPTRAATGAAGSSTWSSCPPGVDRDAAVRGDARARRGLQALPARDPPDELLPRALRPPRGRVPGLRGRRPPLAGAAVLPAS